MAFKFNPCAPCCSGVTDVVTSGCGILFLNLSTVAANIWANLVPTGAFVHNLTNPYVTNLTPYRLIALAQPTSGNMTARGLTNTNLINWINGSPDRRLFLIGISGEASTVTSANSINQYINNLIADAGYGLQIHPNVSNATQCLKDPVVRFETTSHYLNTDIDHIHIGGHAAATVTGGTWLVAPNATALNENKPFCNFLSAEKLSSRGEIVLCGDSSFPGGNTKTHFYDLPQEFPPLPANQFSYAYNDGEHPLHNKKFFANLYTLSPRTQVIRTDCYDNRMSVPCCKYQLPQVLIGQVISAGDCQPLYEPQFLIGQASSVNDSITSGPRGWRYPHYASRFDDTQPLACAGPTGIVAPIVNPPACGGLPYRPGVRFTLSCQNSGEFTSFCYIDGSNTVFATSTIPAENLFYNGGCRDFDLQFTGNLNRTPNPINSALLYHDGLQVNCSGVLTSGTPITWRIYDPRLDAVVTPSEVNFVDTSLELPKFVTNYLKIRRTGDAANYGYVNYHTEHGTATRQYDFNMASGLLVFGVGVTERILAMRGDGGRCTDEGKTFDIVLSNPSPNLTIGGNDRCTLSVGNKASSQNVALVNNFCLNWHFGIKQTLPSKLQFIVTNGGSNIRNGTYPACFRGSWQPITDIPVPITQDTQGYTAFEICINTSPAIANQPPGSIFQNCYVVTLIGFGGSGGYAILRTFYTTSGFSDDPIIILTKDVDYVCGPPFHVFSKIFTNTSNPNRNFTLEITE